ncbi:MAG: phosphatidate cytidylyltransferase [Betaproteobacteria bacterium]|nr:phosphatidate cytidylyltransferase [Betaproteobacteria bacterium]
MLKTRVITALLLVTGLLAALFLLPQAGMVAIFTAIAAIAAWEWAGLLKASVHGRWLYGLATWLPCAAIYAFGMSAALLTALWLLALVFWLLLVPLWFRQRWLLHADTTGFLIGWLLLIPSWAGMVSLYTHSPWLLLAAMALVWIADIAAYFTGRAFGRHKLAPYISPGKTWEGALGAAFAVLVYAAVLAGSMGWLAKLSLLQIILAIIGALLLTVVSILGDLFESLVKRQAGVKDSSALLPGHGGILDRIDSLTSTLPLVGLAVLLGA